MAVNTETHIWYREYQTGMFRPKWEIYIIYPPPKSQGSLWKRVWEGCKREKQWMTTRKWCLPDTTGQLYI